MRRIALALLFLLATTATFAQPAPPKMTWVRQYQIERGREADFLRLIRENYKPLLDGLQQQGKVVGWGIAVPINETEETWTHLLYIGLQDWSSVQAMDAAVDKGMASMPPEAMARTEKLISSIHEGSMHDFVLRHVVQPSAPLPPTQLRYIVSETYKIKPGREGEAVQLFNEWAVPLFSDLASKGTIGPWGLSVHGIPGAAGWTHMVWYFLPDLGAMDTMIRAGESIEPRKLQGFDVRLRDMSETPGHRQQIMKIVTP